MNNTQEDIQGIIDYCHEFAELILNKSGEFYPFGVMIDLKGSLIPFGFEDNETEKLSIQNVINELTKACSDYLSESKIRAYGIACDVKVSINDLEDKSDAIFINVFHSKDNQTRKYYFTYNWTGNNELVFNGSFGINRI